MDAREKRTIVVMVGFSVMVDVVDVHVAIPQNDSRKLFCVCSVSELCVL